MAVPQDQIVANTNQVCLLLRQFTDALATASALVNTYTQLNGANVLGALPTAATNADGSLGAADPSPTTGNLIDTRIVSSLSISISAYDAGVMTTLLQEFQNLLNGVAVETVSAAPALLAKASLA